jgi:hypothetical protein
LEQKHKDSAAPKPHVKPKVLAAQDSPTAYLALNVNGYSAITLGGRNIYYRPDRFPAPFDNLDMEKLTHQQELALLVHESVHILQQRQSEFLPLWYIYYLAEGVNKGYEGIEAEIVAHSVEYAVGELLSADPGAFVRSFDADDLWLLRRSYQERLHLEKARLETISQALISRILPEIVERFPFPGIGGDAFP